MAVGNTIGKLTAEPMLPKTTPAGSGNPPEKKSWWSKWGDVVHTGLDILGAVPVIGIVADGANAAIYAAEGDYVNAAISGASAAANLIPGGGAAMKAGKAAVAVGKQVAKTAAKEGAEALAKKAAKEAAEKAAKEAAEKAAKEAAEAAGKKTAKKAGSDVGGGIKGKGKKKPCKNKKCVGKPVNPLLGVKFLSGAEEIDFELPSPLALPWQRSYFSDQAGNGWLGQGWSLPLSTRLLRSADGLVLVDEQGRETELPELDEGEQELDRYESIILSREANGRYRVSSADGGLHQIFAPLELDSGDRQGERSTYLPLVAIEDRNFNRVRIYYGDDGLPVQLIDSAGRLFGLQFETLAASGLPVSRLRGVALLHGAPPPDGRWPAAQIEMLVRYDYDAHGDLVSVADGQGRPRRGYAYRHHILVEHSQPGGIVSRYEYDRYSPQGKVLEHTTSTGQSWRFEYLSTETRVTDNLGRLTRYLINGDQELVGVVDASGGHTRIEVNAWGKPTAVTDPAGRTTRYQYDADGILAAIIDPANGRTEVQYHELWQLPVAITDAAGAIRRYDYDTRGNLVRETDALGQATSYNHDERGCVVRITDAAGGRRLLKYDECAQVIAHTDCIGNTTQYQWDSYGRHLVLQEADGSSTEYVWDERGRLLRTTYADGGTDRYAYDAAGRLVRHTNPAGHSTNWELAPDGAPLSRTDALGHKLAYQYDAVRRLVVLTNENGNFYRFAYDARDNVVGEQGFDGRVVLYSFDAADNLTERRELGTQPGPGVEANEADCPELLRTQYVRDAAGRLIEKITARARDKRVLQSRYEYDAAGRLASAVSAGGRITLGYDELGRVIEETSLSLGRQQAVQYRYDALGNCVETLLPDGRSLKQRFYGPGYLDQISLDGEVVSSIERDVMQRETVRSQGALVSYFDYDAMGRCVGQRARKNGLDAKDRIARHYVYDRQGNLQAASDLRFGQVDYRYDVLGRLTQANKERFAFDPAHNLVEAAGETVRANRVVRFEDKQFRYDTHGNLVEKRVGGNSILRFAYDPDHQLESAEVTRNGVTQKTSYGYDAFGRRSWKRDSFGTTEFFWHGDRLLQEIRQSRRLVYIYEPDGFAPLAQVESPLQGSGEQPAPPAKLRYFHTDQAGTPREVTESDGSISWRASYRAWGNTLLVEYPEPSSAAAAEPVHQPLRFQGQYFDAETGLHYNRFRYYDPDIGRFVSQDPIGLAGGLNSYLYAPNPVAWADPLGLTCASSLIRYKPRDELTAQAGKRQDAIDRAWALEKEMLENGMGGTRAWSPAERAAILNTPVGSKPGQLSSVMSNAGYTGHHINSVKNNGTLGTKWQGDPRNIVFLQNDKHPNSTNMPNAYNEHFHSPQGHRGSTKKNPSRGRLIDRRAMIDAAKRGCQ